MKKYISILFVICIISFVECKRQGSNTSITCINGTSINEEKYLSSVFKNSEIIRLETIDESLIGRRINKIKNTDNKYYISYDNKSLVIFDHQGKFLRKIQNIGGGPGEYISLVDFDILPNGNIIIQDIRKLLLYSSTGKFIKTIPLTITCFNLKTIDDDNFLICASGEKYSIYLINGNGDILSEQIKTNNKPVLGRSVAFFAFSNDCILYQQDMSNDFLSFNKQTKKFFNTNLLCSEDHILSVEDVKKYPKRNDNLNYVEDNPNVKIIGGFSSYADYLFFACGNQNSGFKCYLMNTLNNTIDYVLTKNTVNDISFTDTFSLLGKTSISDSEDCFISYLYPYQIIDGLKDNVKLRELPNYQRLDLLFKNIKNIENENPVLIELRR